MTIRLLCMLSLSACITFISCAKEDDTREEGNSEIQINLAKDEAVPVDGVVEIPMTINNFENLDYLKVVKETNYGKLPAKHGKALLTDRFTYVYLMKETDPERVTLEFTAYDTEGKASESRSVRITNPGLNRTKDLKLSNLQCLSRVTGAEDNGHDGLPTIKYTLNNRTDLKFNVGGTDLGIIWEMSENKFGMFFGDTYGADFKPNHAAPGPNGGSWRSNVILLSNDTELSNGLTINGAVMEGNQAKEICFSAHNTSGTGDWTSIPTAAIHAGNADYVHYMNIKTWTGWVTNYSSLYKSTDGGKDWDRVNGVNFSGDSNFGQCGYYKNNGKVYMMATQTGRDGMPYLARFNEKDIEDTGKYEFWNGFGWATGKENAATQLFNDKVGELSFSYMPELKKWVLLYFNGTRYEISMRYADNVEGPWSEPVQVASGRDWPQLYGSFIHPLSKKGTTLYFIMSMWLPYNTYLMSIDLKASK